MEDAQSSPETKYALIKNDNIIMPYHVYESHYKKNGKYNLTFHIHQLVYSIKPQIDVGIIRTIIFAAFIQEFTVPGDPYDKYFEFAKDIADEILNSLNTHLPDFAADIINRHVPQTKAFLLALFMISGKARNIKTVCHQLIWP